jgi:uncharacterized protein
VLRMSDQPVPSAPSASPARTWEMLAHLSALLGFILPLGNLLGPFLVWQLKKNEYPSVETHARAALNFQISCLIYFLVAALLVIIAVGIPLMFAVGLFNLIFVILSTIAVNDGKPWNYPASLKFL